MMQGLESLLVGRSARLTQPDAPGSVTSGSCRAAHVASQAVKTILPGCQDESSVGP